MSFIKMAHENHSVLPGAEIPIQIQRIGLDAQGLGNLSQFHSR